MNIEVLKRDLRGLFGIVAVLGATVAAAGLVAKLITLVLHSELGVTWMITYCVWIVTLIIAMNVSDKFTDKVLNVIGWATE